jgi:glutamate 5-kinase
MKRILIKFGTESLTGNGGKLDQSVFDQIASQLALLMAKGFEVAIVTSGAVQAGYEEMESLGIQCVGWHKKDFAASGTCRLMQMWRESFRIVGRGVGQILVTHSNFRDHGERQSIAKAIQNHMKAGVVPILNENDVVSDREIRSMDQRISENDYLTYLLSEMLRPNIVVAVTSVGGVYNKFPMDKNSLFYSELDVRNLPSIGAKSSEKSASGTGGMSKKIVEFAKCYKRGRLVGIIKWQNEGIVRFVNGEETGTCLKLHNRFRK